MDVGAIASNAAQSGVFSRFVVSGTEQQPYMPKAMQLFPCRRTTPLNQLGHTAQEIRRFPSCISQLLRPTDPIRGFLPITNYSQQVCPLKESGNLIYQSVNTMQNTLLAPARLHTSQTIDEPAHMSSQPLRWTTLGDISPEVLPTGVDSAAIPATPESEQPESLSEPSCLLMTELDRLFQGNTEAYRSEIPLSPVSQLTASCFPGESSSLSAQLNLDELREDFIKDLSNYQRQTEADCSESDRPTESVKVSNKLTTKSCTNTVPNQTTSQSDLCSHANTYGKKTGFDRSLPHPARLLTEKPNPSQRILAANTNHMPTAVDAFAATSAAKIPSPAWDELPPATNSLPRAFMETSLPPSPVSSPDVCLQQILISQSPAEDESNNDGGNDTSASVALPTSPKEQPHRRRSPRDSRKRRRLPSESPSPVRTKPTHKSGCSNRSSRPPPKKPAKIKTSALEPKNKHGNIPKSLQLFEFLLHLLELRKARNCIKWEDAHQGRFQIVDSTNLANKWGVYRAKPEMNYDKMSRAMRFYYKRQILDKTSGRLHYKFTEMIMKQVEQHRQLHPVPDENETSESEIECESDVDSPNDANDESDEFYVSESSSNLMS